MTKHTYHVLHARPTGNILPGHSPLHVLTTFGSQPSLFINIDCHEQCSYNRMTVLKTACQSYMFCVFLETTIKHCNNFLLQKRSLASFCSCL